VNNDYSEVMTMDRTVGVIGLGSVGTCVIHALSFYFQTTGYDVQKEFSWEDILKASIVFICVPTPEGQYGRLDCSIVKEILNRLDDDEYRGIIVVKSTVGIGFMDASERNHPALRLVYMPEFLREKDSLTWFVAPDRLVISGAKADIKEALEYFYWVDDSAERLIMSYREAELGKLAHNAFISVKVSFTNEIEAICRENHVDAKKVMSVIWADRRVKSKEHLRPYIGPYRGKCVPKDTRELLNSSKSTSLLKAVEEVNERTKVFYQNSEFDDSSCPPKNKFKAR